jgi:hypothetical protein
LGAPPAFGLRTFENRPVGFILLGDAVATFSITDQTGATYQVDAPDEYAAMRALGQVSPHVAAALAAPQARPAGNYWDSAPLAAAAPAPRLVPVDHDPFATAPAAPRAPLNFDDLLPPPVAPPGVRAGAFDDLSPPPVAAAPAAPGNYWDSAPLARAPTLIPVDHDPFAPSAASPQAPSWLKSALLGVVAPVAGSLIGAPPTEGGSIPTMEGVGKDVVRNAAGGATLGFGDKALSLINGTSLADERAQSQAAMDRQGILGNAEQIAGMMAPAGLIGKAVGAIGKAVGAIGGAAKTVPLVGRVLGDPYIQAAATGAGVGAGNAAGNDTDLLRGALTGAGAGVLGKGVADAATIPVGWLAGKFNAAPVIPSAADIAAEKTAAYAAADKAGVIVTPDAARRLAGNIRAIMASHNYDPATEPQGGAILSTLARFPAPPPATPGPAPFGFAGASGAGVGMSAAQPPVPQGVTLQRLDGLRQVVGKLYGGNPSEQALAAKIINGTSVNGAPVGGIDSFVNGLQPADIFSGNAPESAAIQSIIDGTPTQNALRIIGKFSPTGSGLMTALESVGTVGMLDHAGALGAASAMAVPAIGYAAKTVADKASVGGMTRLGDLVRSGGNAAAIAPAQNVVQRAAQGANAPLSTGAMTSLIHMLGVGATDSVSRADATSRANTLANTLIRARDQRAPGLGAVFAR